MAGKIELHDPSHPTFKERQKQAAEKSAKEAAAKTPETKPTTK